MSKSDTTMTMIIDVHIDFLRAAAALVDTRLERLDIEAEASPDPDAFGILDQGEYLTGFGFVACQTYLTAIVSRRNLKKYKALEFGPKHRTGRSMAQLTNAAANHWKHSAEWSLDALTPQAKETLEVISSLGIDTNLGSYPIANTLYEILKPHPTRFSNLIPFLMQWRDALSIRTAA